MPDISPLTSEELKAAEALKTTSNTNKKDNAVSIMPVPDGVTFSNKDLAHYNNLFNVNKPTKAYRYHNKSGELLGHIVRWDFIRGGLAEKEYRPFLYCESQKWISRGFPEPRPLYNLHKIVVDLDKSILVCEGEKTSDAAKILLPDCTTTTSMHGAESPHKTDWSPIERRLVIICPDYDEAGKIYADAVYKLCQQAGARSIKLFRIEIFAQYAIENGQIIECKRELPDGYDLADALEEGWTADLLLGFEKNTGVPLFLEYEDIFPGSGNECSDTETLQRLATLSPIEYDRVKKDEAKRLGVSMPTLNEEVKKWRAQNSNEEKKELSDIFPTIEPWADPVILDEILTEISILFNRFAILPIHADTALALWVTFTWCIDYVDVAPILTLYSPEKQCGKTTVLSIIGKLALKSLPASNISAAALFRAVEKWQPTLIIDEADTFIGASDELRGIINSGHTRSNAYVIRTVGEDHTPKQFSTWGAKAIALIGKLPDTLHDRSIVIELRRKHRNEKTEKLRHADLQVFVDLQRKLLRFSQDNANYIKNARPNLPTNISDRAADNWDPLLAIAELAGPSWIERAHKAAIFLSSRVKDSVSLGNQLLLNIQQIFQSNGVDKIPTAELIEDLCKDDELQWLTHNAGKPITPRQIAILLGAYKIHSKNIKMEDGTVLKGFEKSQFKDAWNRYLSPNPSENAATPLPIQLLSNKGANFEEFLPATESVFLTTLDAASATEKISKTAPYDEVVAE